MRELILKVLIVGIVSATVSITLSVFYPMSRKHRIVDWCGDGFIDYHMASDSTIIGTIESSETYFVGDTIQ